MAIYKMYLSDNSIDNWTQNEGLRAYKELKTTYLLYVQKQESITKHDVNHIKDKCDNEFLYAMYFMYTYIKNKYL